MSAERLRRWRLVLGGDAGRPRRIGARRGRPAMDGALAALYGGGRRGDRGADGPRRRSRRVGAPGGALARRHPRRTSPLRRPGDAARRDRPARADRLLLEPEMLEAVEPDVHLVGTLLVLNRVMPGDAQATARRWSARWSTRWSGASPNAPGPAVTGALEPGRPDPPARGSATSTGTAPSRANLQHYLPEQRTVVPERLVGYGRRSSAVAARRDPGDRPVRVDGGLGRLRLRVRRRAGVDARAADLAGGLRHRGRRPHRATGRPGRRAVRHAARRRHRHQPGDRLLPVARSPGRRTRCSS